MISNDVDEELDQNIKGFYEFLSSDKIGLKKSRYFSDFLKTFEKKIESNLFEKKELIQIKSNDREKNDFLEKENKKLSLYKISNDDTFRNIIKKFSINTNEINEFLKKKKEYDSMDSYKFIISIAIYKYQKSQENDLKKKLDYSFFDNEFFKSRSKNLSVKFSKLDFNNFDDNLSRKDLPYLTSKKEIESEIKIFFFKKLGFFKNRDIPSPSLLEAYKIYKFAYRDVRDHLIKEKLITPRNKRNPHIEKLEEIIRLKINDEEKLKEIKSIIINIFKNIEFYDEKLNENESNNENLDFYDNEDNSNHLINKEYEVFHKINQKLKEYNVSISLEEFDEVLKLKINNYTFSLDQNLDGIDGNKTLLDTMSSEIKEDDIVNEQSQMELLKALFSLFVSNNESKKLYRRKLYILFLEYILNMSNQDIADSICDSPASVSLAKKDLISDLSYLAKSNINFYLDNWFDKDNNFGDISKQDLLKKLSIFDKEKKSYEENLLEYFNSKENSNSNIDNLRKGLLNFKISEEIRKLSSEDKNIIFNLNEKLLKGNFLENQLDKYSKTDEQKNNLLLLLSKFPDKSKLLKETFNFNVDDFRSFIEFSEKSLSNKFTNIHKLFFQNIELINKKAENMNKDVFFLLLSLFSIASLEEIKYNNKKFIKFNSYNSFDDFETHNVLMKFISNIEMENDCLKFGELQGVSNAR
jgi:hypothetical protein